MDYLQYLKGAPNDQDVVDLVLNLVINGLPSIRNIFKIYDSLLIVLNLVINGLPSILN